MKGKDNRIVTIYATTQDSQQIAINVLLSELEKAYNQAKKNGRKEIFIQYDESKNIKLSLTQVRRIIVSTKKQYNSEKLIPKTLKEYLTLNISTVCGKIVGRDQEIDRVWTYLTSQRKSNAILIGKRGVGKTTIAAEIMRQINLGESPKQFRNYYVLTLNTSTLLDLAEKSNSEKSNSEKDNSEEIRFTYLTVIQQLCDFAKENKERIIFYIDNLLDVKYDLELVKLFKKCVFEYNIKFVASINNKDFEDYFEIDSEFMKYLNNIWIEEPEIEELYPMLKKQINALQMAYGVTISEKMVRFAISTAYFHARFNKANPEITVDAINFALADAQRRGQKEVTKQNFFTYYKINFRCESKMNEERKKISAYHEAGHYLVGKLSQTLTFLQLDSVSILPAEDYEGITVAHADTRKLINRSKEYFIDDIAFSLAGRVGEMFYTKDFSAGAEEDLASANNTAEQIVLSLGLAGVEGEDNKTYIAMGYVKDYLLTDEVKTKINKEIAKLMEEGFKRAKNIIEDNKELFEELVQRLLEDKILVTDELDEICEKYGVS